MPESVESRLARVEERSARLDERSEALLRAFARIERDVEAFGPTAGQLIEVAADVRAYADDLNELKDDVKDLIDDIRTTRGMSTTVKVALIGGCAALLTALITAIAQIVSGG